MTIHEYYDKFWNLRYKKQLSHNRKFHYITVEPALCDHCLEKHLDSKTAHPGTICSHYIYNEAESKDHL